MDVVFTGPNSLGEGSMWDHRTNRLYWIDINDKQLLHQSFAKEEAGEAQSIALSGMPGTVVLTQNPDEVVLAQDDGVKRLNIASGEVTHLIDFPESTKMRFNDGKCDSAGRFWVGTMDRDGELGAGTLYRIDPDLTMHPQVHGVTCSNGIVWSQDDSTMYYIDSYTLQVRAYDFDAAKGEVSNPRTVVEVPEDRAYPDGMTIDTEDRLWVAHWNGSCVASYDPKTGETLQVLPVPTLKVTSCVFGGTDLSTLYITTALGSQDGGWTDREAYPLSGALFQTQPGAKGRQARIFAG